MFYSGIDLSARDYHLCVLDDSLSIHLHQKVPNEPPRVSNLLEPFKPNLQIVVESTFKWYWLVYESCPAARSRIRLSLRRLLLREGHLSGSSNEIKLAIDEKR